MDTEQCTEACKTLAQPVGFWQVERAALGALSLGPETSQDQMTQTNQMGEVEGQQKAKYKDEVLYPHDLEGKKKNSSKADLSVVQLCCHARSNCGKVFCPACPGGPETPVLTEHTASLNMNLELRWALSRWIILWGKN